MPQLWNYNWIISLKVQCSCRLKFKCHCSASRTGVKQNGYVNSEAICNPINSQIHSSIIWNVLILTNPKELGLWGHPIKVTEGNISGDDVIIPWFYQGYSEWECRNRSRKILHLFVWDSIRVSKTSAPHICLYVWCVYHCLWHLQVDMCIYTTI